MQKVNGVFSGEFSVKKSLFIAYVCPIFSRQDLHEKLKKDHAKAAHIAWAYREFGAQIRENQSDDGEPKNSAGMPILSVLRGRDLIDTCIFVVRYFGGIKLGVGGLVRAYGTAANLALNSAKFSDLTSEFSLFSNFSNLNKLEHYFKSKNINFSKYFNEKGCEIKLNLSDEQMLEFSHFCADWGEFGEQLINNLTKVNIIAK